MVSAPAIAALESGPRGTLPYDDDPMADEQQLSLQDQLEEIGTQLDWVRGYL